MRGVVTLLAFVSDIPVQRVDPGGWCRCSTPRPTLHMWKSTEQVVFVVRWESVVRRGLEKGTQARSYQWMGGGEPVTSCRVPR